MNSLKKVIVVKDGESSCECWGKCLKQVYNSVGSNFKGFLYLRVYTVVDGLTSADFKEELIGSCSLSYSRLRENYYIVYDKII